MRHKELYARISSQRSPWYVANVELLVNAGKVRRCLAADPETVVINAALVSLPEAGEKIAFTQYIIKTVASTFRKQLWGMFNVPVLQVNNGLVEGLASLVRKINVDSRGYPNKVRFMTAIFCHSAGFDRYPDGVTR